MNPPLPHQHTQKTLFPTAASGASQLDAPGNTLQGTVARSEESEVHDHRAAAALASSGVLQRNSRSTEESLVRRRHLSAAD